MAADLAQGLLANPLFDQVAFHPRKVRQGKSAISKAVDGALPISSDVALGWRLFPHPAAAGAATPLVVAWHGNGEVAADYDHVAPLWTDMGASLLVLDFGGYGWSTGTVTITTLAPQAAAVAPLLTAEFYDAVGIVPPSYTVALGRSMGSVAAVAMVAAAPGAFAGLILDAGIAQLFTLPMAQMVLGVVSPEEAKLVEGGGVPDPFDNERLLAQLPTPLLALHGDADAIVPHTHGEANVAASAAPADKKRLVTWPGAGHNDAMARYMVEYVDEVKAFLQACAPEEGAGAAEGGAVTDAGGAQASAGGRGGGIDGGEVVPGSSSVDSTSGPQCSIA